MTVNDNINEQNETVDNEMSVRTVKKRQPVPAKGKGKAKQLPKGRNLRGRGKQQASSNDDSSDDSETENKPRKGRRQKKIVDLSSSENEEPFPRKISQAANRKPAAARSTRSSRTKIIEENSTSGENILRENNSFEN